MLSWEDYEDQGDVMPPVLVRETLDPGRGPVVVGGAGQSGGAAPA